MVGGKSARRNCRGATARAFPLRRAGPRARAHGSDPRPPRRPRRTPRDPAPGCRCCVRRKERAGFLCAGRMTRKLSGRLKLESPDTSGIASQCPVVTFRFPLEPTYARAPVRGGRLPADREHATLIGRGSCCRRRSGAVGMRATISSTSRSRRLELPSEPRRSGPAIRAGACCRVFPRPDVLAHSPMRAPGRCRAARTLRPPGDQGRPAHSSRSCSNRGLKSRRARPGQGGRRATRDFRQYLTTLRRPPGSPESPASGLAVARAPDRLSRFGIGPDPESSQSQPMSAVCTGAEIAYQVEGTIRAEIVPRSKPYAARWRHSGTTSTCGYFEGSARCCSEAKDTTLVRDRPVILFDEHFGMTMSGAVRCASLPRGFRSMAQLDRDDQPIRSTAAQAIAPSPVSDGLGSPRHDVSGTRTGTEPGWASRTSSRIVPSRRRAGALVNRVNHSIGLPL